MVISPPEKLSYGVVSVFRQIMLFVEDSQVSWASQEALNLNNNKSTSQGVFGTFWLELLVGQDAPRYHGCLDGRACMWETPCYREPTTRYQTYQVGQTGS